MIKKGQRGPLRNAGSRIRSVRFDFSHIRSRTIDLSKRVTKVMCDARDVMGRCIAKGISAINQRLSDSVYWIYAQFYQFYTPPSPPLPPSSSVHPVSSSNSLYKHNQSFPQRISQAFTDAGQCQVHFDWTSDDQEDLAVFAHDRRHDWCLENHRLQYIKE